MNVKSPAGHEDAQLILNLYELRREEKMRAARDWFAREFFPQSIDDIKATLNPANPNNAYFRMVTSYWDMAASFVVHGVLNGELFLESGGEMLFVWAKIGDFIPQMREEFGLQVYLSNIEKVIGRVDWAPDRVAWLRNRIEQARKARSA